MVLMAIAAAVTWGAAGARAQGEGDAPELRAGRNFMTTQVYSAKEDEAILQLFAGLRVTDVMDGMDQAGLQNIGAMDPEIGPLWKDLDHFKHRIVGIAVTARYVPTNRPPAGARSVEQFDQWVGQWYNRLSPEPFVPIIRQGTVLVIDDANAADVGTIGSNNIMSWRLRGCEGVITTASARDTS